MDKERRKIKKKSKSLNKKIKEFGKYTKKTFSNPNLDYETKKELSDILKNGSIDFYKLNLGIFEESLDELKKINEKAKIDKDTKAQEESQKLIDEFEHDIVMIMDTIIRLGGEVI